MSTQHIYASSNLRKIGLSASNNEIEKDSTGMVSLTMDLTTSYITRVSTLLTQLLAAKTQDQKSSIVARINVIRQELSFITGMPLESIQMTVAMTDNSM
jgi:hypothetical protein